METNSNPPEEKNENFELEHFFKNMTFVDHFFFYKRKFFSGESRLVKESSCLAVTDETRFFFVFEQWLHSGLQFFPSLLSKSLKPNCFIISQQITWIIEVNV